jgi:amino acid transporter
MLTAPSGFGMIIALLFSLGNLDEVLAAPVSQLGYPVIQIYYQATGSLHGANAMTAVSLVIVIMAHFGLMAGCSRTAWAFARDRGLPASDYLSHVSTRSQVPFRAIMLSVVIQVLLGLINIGSSAAFLAFVNAAAATLYITYVGPSTSNSLHEFSIDHLVRSHPSSSASSSAGAASTSHTALSSSADTAMSSTESLSSTPCSQRSSCYGRPQRTRMHRR